MTKRKKNQNDWGLSDSQWAFIWLLILGGMISYLYFGHWRQNPFETSAFAFWAMIPALSYVAIYLLVRTMLALRARKRGKRDGFFKILAVTLLVFPLTMIAVVPAGLIGIGAYKVFVFLDSHSPGILGGGGDAGTVYKSDGFEIHSGGLGAMGVLLMLALGFLYYGIPALIFLMLMVASGVRVSKISAWAVEKWFDRHGKNAEEICSTLNISTGVWELLAFVGVMAYMAV